MKPRALLLVLFVWACGDAGSQIDGGEDGLPDGGQVHSDAGAELDAGLADAGNPDAGPPPVPKYEEEIRPLFDLKCGFCHGESAMGKLDLRGAPAEVLIDVPSDQLPQMMLVRCGEPALSYLWHKASNTHLAAGGTGLMMPPGQALAQGELEQVAGWILGGCPD